MSWNGNEAEGRPSQPASCEPSTSSIAEGPPISTSAVDAYIVDDHSSNTMELLKRDMKHCDAVIEAGGEKFKIHKSVFAIYSDYFDKVFTVEMQEKYDNEVKIENTRANVIKCIIDFVYTGQLSINRENAIELLEAADYLHIEKIKELCVKFLLSNLDTENCISVWICAKTCDITDLREQSETVFGTNLLSVAREELKWLSSEQFLEIMQSSKETRKSAKESFCITVDWAKCDLETRKEAFGEIFQSFDLSLFSNDFLSDITKNKSLITKSPALVHQVITELSTRLDEATEREEKANQKIAKLEEDKQASGEKTDWLVEENKRLIQRNWVSDEQLGQLQEALNYYIDKSEQKSNEAKEWHKRNSASQCQYEKVIATVRNSGKNISDLINTTSKPSRIWDGIYVSSENKNLINKHLKEIEF